MFIRVYIFFIYLAKYFSRDDLYFRLLLSSLHPLVPTPDCFKADTTDTIETIKLKLHFFCPRNGTENGSRKGSYDPVGCDP